MARKVEGVAGAGDGDAPGIAGRAKHVNCEDVISRSGIYRSAAVAAAHIREGDESVVPTKCRITLRSFKFDGYLCHKSPQIRKRDYNKKGTAKYTVASWLNNLLQLSLYESNLLPKLAFRQWPIFWYGTAD